MCETNVIPEKEVIPNKKQEKEKQFKQEEEPITVIQRKTILTIFYFINIFN